MRDIKVSDRLKSKNCREKGMHEALKHISLSKKSIFYMHRQQAWLQVFEKFVWVPEQIIFGIIHQKVLIYDDEESLGCPYASGLCRIKKRVMANVCFIFFLF